MASIFDCLFGVRIQLGGTVDFDSLVCMSGCQKERLGHGGDSREVD